MAPILSYTAAVHAGFLPHYRNVLSRSRQKIGLDDLQSVYDDLRAAAQEIRLGMSGHSLFEARPFRELVISARESADRRIVRARR
ncbi:MAG: hypothetical protein WAU33_00955 [Candidatus Binataceae bacterium]